MLEQLACVDCTALGRQTSQVERLLAHGVGALRVLFLGPIGSAARPDRSSGVVGPGSTRPHRNLLAISAVTVMSALPDRAAVPERRDDMDSMQEAATVSHGQSAGAKLRRGRFGYVGVCPSRGSW